MILRNKDNEAKASCKKDEKEEKNEKSAQCYYWEQSTSTVKVWHQMYEGLYGMDEASNGYYKELAKDVSLSDDLKEYTITLLDGVKFQNGEDLKASDIVFTYERAMQNPRFNYVTNMIDTIVAEGDDTVKITLKEPFSAIDHTFFTIKIVSEKEVTDQGEKFGTIPNKAGTGPYYATEYEIASGLKLDAFEDYWRGAPNIKHIEYRVISDNAAAVIAFENGELDYFEDAPLSDWDSLVASAGDNNSLTAGNNILFLAVNYSSPTNNGVLANDKVREAIFYAINREDINYAVCDGLGEITDYNNIRQQVHSESEGMYVVKYKDGPFNWQRMEELCDLGVSTSDVEERLAYYTELWALVMDSQTIYPALNRPVPTVWAADLDIGTPVPTYYKVRTFSWK